MGPIESSLLGLEGQTLDGSETLDQDPVIGSVGPYGVDRPALDVRVEDRPGVGVESQPDGVLEELGRRDGRQRRVRVLLVEHVSRFDPGHAAVDEESVEGFAALAVGRNLAVRAEADGLGAVKGAELLTSAVVDRAEVLSGLGPIRGVNLDVPEDFGANVVLEVVDAEGNAVILLVAGQVVENVS